MAYSQGDREWALYVLSEVGSASENAHVAGCSAASIPNWADQARAPRIPCKPPVHLPCERKADILWRHAAVGRAEDLAAKAGVTPAAVYRWRADLREKGAPAIMSSEDVAARAAEPPEGLEELRRRDRKLELRAAVPEGTVEMLRKAPEPTRRA